LVHSERPLRRRTRTPRVAHYVSKSTSATGGLGPAAEVVVRPTQRPEEVLLAVLLVCCLVLIGFLGGVLYSIAELLFP
jgi:hypothetical protein